MCILQFECGKFVWHSPCCFSFNSLREVNKLEVFTTSYCCEPLMGKSVSRWNLVFHNIFFLIERMQYVDKWLESWSWNIVNKMLGELWLAPSQYLSSCNSVESGNFIHKLFFQLWSFLSSFVDRTMIACF